MKVKDVMITDVKTLTPKTTWKQAAELFVEWGISAAPVLDAQGGLVGILSEKSLFRGLFPTYEEWSKHPEAFLDFDQMEADAVYRTSERLVEEVMSTNLITASPETPVLQVGALMVARNIHQVPVLEQGRLVGMVKRGKIYNEILKRYFQIQHK